MKHLLLYLAAMFVGLVGSGRAVASDQLWKLAPSISLSIYKEQLKDSAGNPTTQITANRQLALMTTGTYAIDPALDLGLFFMAEKGTRTVISDGPADYTLFWVGPMVRGNWRSLFVELCYVLYGVRSDEDLRGIASESGDNTSAFRTDPGKAWLLGLGGTLPVSQDLELYLKLEYRFHYYDRRGSENLQADASLGSQAVRPHIGLLIRL